MIEKPDLNMSEVAYRVGFSDPNYFSRTFKKNYNISPTDFRNNKGAELEIKN
jgi:AraC-like DNA-binding protein